MKIEDLLRDLVERSGSDLHLKVGAPPSVRVDGSLKAMSEYERLRPEDTRDLVQQVLTPEELADFDRDWDYDCSFSLAGMSRFRINCLQQRGSCGLVIRAIPWQTPTLSDIQAPPVLKKLCQMSRGLVLVTGPTGSGKSTTLAAMIDSINEHRDDHILTLEDPIEFIHRDKRCLVNQRELGADCRSFSEGLRRALRQDPDVILVGELSDLETISLALTAAETGHLVLSTLHTTGAVQTVDRIVDVFPERIRQQIRLQLSMELGGVVSQCLLPRIGGGRIPAMEIMIANDAVKALIRDGKTHMIQKVMQTDRTEGMQTLDGVLADYVGRKIVSPEDAMARAPSPQLVSNQLGARPTVGTSV